MRFFTDRLFSGTVRSLTPLPSGPPPLLYRPSPLSIRRCRIRLTQLPKWPPLSVVPLLRRFRIILSPLLLRPVTSAFQYGVCRHIRFARIPADFHHGYLGCLPDFFAQCQRHFP